MSPPSRRGLYRIASRSGEGDRWAEVEVERVPGNHLTLMAEPHVGVLAERLRVRLT